MQHWYRVYRRNIADLILFWRQLFGFDGRCCEIGRISRSSVAFSLFFYVWHELVVRHGPEVFAQTFLLEFRRVLHLEGKVGAVVGLGAFRLAKAPRDFVGCTGQRSSMCSFSAQRLSNETAGRKTEF